MKYEESDRYNNLSHQSDVFFYIGAEDGGEFTFKTFICHNGPLFQGFKQSNSVCGLSKGAQESEGKPGPIL